MSDNVNSEILLIDEFTVEARIFTWQVERGLVEWSLEKFFHRLTFSTPKGRTFYPLNKPLDLNLLSTNDTSFSEHYGNTWHWIKGLPYAPPNSIYVARILNEGSENQNLRTYIARPVQIINIYGTSIEPGTSGEAFHPILETDADRGDHHETSTHSGQWQGMLIPEYYPTYGALDTAVDSFSNGVFIRSWGCTSSRLVLLGYYA